MRTMDGWIPFVLGTFVFAALFTPPPALAQSSAAITGVVLDQTGGVLVGVNVALVSQSNTILQTQVSDAAGQFHFTALGSGRYDIRTTLDGFKTTDTRVNVQPGSSRALRIVMLLAAVKQEVTVSNASATVDTRAASNVDAVTL